MVMGVSAATLVLSSLFVGFRLISRFAVLRKPGWDDYTIIVAWILAFGASFSICYGATKGLGRHQEDIPTQWLAPMKQSAFVFSVLYVRATRLAVRYVVLNTPTESSIDGNQNLDPPVLSHIVQDPQGLSVGDHRHSSRRQRRRTGVNHTQRSTMSTRRCSLDLSCPQYGTLYEHRYHISFVGTPEHYYGLGDSVPTDAYPH